MKRNNPSQLQKNISSQHSGSKEAKTVNKRPLQVNLDMYSGYRYYRQNLPSYSWLLEGSLLRESFGVIAGPPGSGKGMLTLQLATALAAGIPALDIWETQGPCKVLYISAEDSRTVIHHRLHDALMCLPDEVRRSAAKNIRAVPVSGRVSLCMREPTGNLVPSDNFYDLRALVNEFRPNVLFLDTLARFGSTDENNNNAMTEVCGILEEIITGYGCNVVVLHHTNKMAKTDAGTDAALSDALTQTAIRGASALLGCVRWALTLAPISQKLAENKLGKEAGKRPTGSYLGIRVVKKNVGEPEPVYFLSRDPETGLLSQVEEDHSMVNSDAEELARIIEERSVNGEDPLAVSRGYVAIDWPRGKYEKAVDAGVALELFEKKKKPKGKGNILCLFDASPEADEDVDNEAMPRRRLSPMGIPVQ